ncbi:MAG TPA: protein kinase [Candidatus Limnocylindria bacterium]|nr:protein kinase [Candidatus Limnocylindria bacterium]
MTTPLRISHYEVLARIGRDGPTEIYRARDLRLERDVALKLLGRDEASRPDGLARFRREARIASLVTHPHICTIHDSGEADGQAFLVLELLEGRALDDVIAAEGALPPDRAIEIALQIADALVAAHRRGIVHANLKPSNVFITHDGHAKLLELGAAGAVSSGETPAVAASHTTAITPVPAIPPDYAREFFHPYLSPEQVRGDAADARSDIFALGALLYHMATGKPPFGGATVAEIAADISSREPASPRRVRAAIPAPLEAIVMRALDKAPERRYQRASDLLDDLRRARRAIEERRRPASIWRRPRYGAAAAAVLAIALIGSAGWWWRNNEPATVERSAILLGDIANGTADPDFDGTLREAISVYLAQSPYLDLVSEERMRSTLQLMGRQSDDRLTHDVAAELCQRLGSQAMLEGSVAAVGRTTVVALAATDCHSDATIAKAAVEVDRKEDVLRALGQLTSDVRRSLGESVASLARNNTPIEEATTPSLEALKAYTEAVARRANGQEAKAVELLERAIAIDPQFALAHTTLSSIYGGFGETGRSEEYARLAYEHRARVSERERLFITYQYHDRVTGDQLKAREALEVWKRTYPKDYRPSNALALLHIRLGNYAEAIAEAQDAMQRNPAHAFPRSNLAHALRGAGRYAESRAVAEKALAENLETTPMRRLLYQLGELLGDGELARRQIEWAANHPRSFDISGARGQVALLHGRVNDARRLFEETMSAATERGFPQVASGYAAQQAFAEVLYGYGRPPLDAARSIVRSATAFEPQLRAAAGLALGGEPQDADALVRRLRGVRPEDTLLQNAYLPVVEAAALLARGHPDAAVEQLRRASPYENGIVAALLPVYLRGIARLRAGHYGEAASEFESLLAHRGADPFSPVVPLAQLGLARARVHLGQAAQGRAAYDALFAMWSAADADLPVLRQAREELAALRDR